MAMRLYLVRHGQTVWNVSNKAQGHVDIDLDETGLAQARLLAERLAGEGVQRILSSDLGRCLQTIQPLAESIGLVPELRSDLRERTFGTMEGEDFTKLHVWMREEAVRLGLPDWEVRPPNGESMADVSARLQVVEHELRSETRAVVVVSHGGALAQLLTRLVKGTPETARVFRFSNCGVTVLNRRPDGSLLLERFNDTDHLEVLREVSRVP
jgi:probable phosphoglycerate mutase